MPDHKRYSSMPWIVLVLLTLSLLINYVDRSTLSFAAPLLQKEFGISATQLGTLFSAFSLTYCIFLILSGWLVDRYNVGWILAIGFFIWSASTLASGFANGFMAFLIIRLVLGAGESVAYPAYSRILVRYFPAERRGLANSVIAIGMPGGLALGSFAGGLAMDHFGWRPFLIVLGLVTLLWLVPWFVWMPRGQGIVTATSDQATPSIPEIVKQPSAWGTWGGLFAMNFVFYFMMNWLPSYLVQERRFSLSKASTVGFVYLIAAILSPMAGWFADHWVTAGATRTRACKTLMVGGQAICAISLAGCVVATADLAFVLLLFAGVGFGVSTSQTWAITQILAGPNASGKWTGIQNFFGNWAGILGPVITGAIIQRTGGFFWAFALTVVVGLLGCLSWIFVVGPLTQVVWRKPLSIPLTTASTDSP